MSAAGLEGELVERFAARVAEALIDVRARITAAGGDPAHITIVAVTKGFGPEAVLAAARNGLRDIGENYADELVAKADALVSADATEAAQLRWHFQGNLQTNKINRLRPWVSLWQTVPSAPRAAALAERVPGAAVLVQVNLTGEQQRSGSAPADVAAVVETARRLGLDVRGLMGIGPGPDTPLPGASLDAFRCLATLADGLALPVRSMGMSGDFEDAIRAGATMVRLGSILFGPRA